ncbi:MAG TPA: S-formylglutathione hydrolase [Herbaspirillum sp.]|jgi:S-formylglutathione hydrolase
MRTISQTKCFGGVQGFHQHDSAVIGLSMKFSVYRPPRTDQPVPILFFLAGLTCTEETFMTKAGAQRYAAEHGIMLVAPDTSPRNTGIAGVAEKWDFGDGAGFYLDATQAPWDQRFRMESYLVDELLSLIKEEFAAHVGSFGNVGIFGHSMGGHGALTLALRHPDVFRSVSAFAPISSPMQCGWGQKAFENYLGSDQETWRAHDASQLMSQRTSPLTPEILIDQGLADQFLRQQQLMPEHFEAACVKAGQPLTLRRHEGYDHGYYFISTFMQDHVAFHAAQLK